MQSSGRIGSETGDVGCQDVGHERDPCPRNWQPVIRQRMEALSNILILLAEPPVAHWHVYCSILLQSRFYTEKHKMGLRFSIADVDGR